MGVFRHDPSLLVKNVGRRIAELRLESGRTQEQIAEALGMSVQYYQRIEAGMNLTLHSLAKIATVLNVPIGSLLMLPSSPAKKSPRRRARARK